MAVSELDEPQVGWDVLRKLIAAGRLVMCREAWNELKRVDPETQTLLADVKDVFVTSIANAQILVEAGRISFVYPKMCRSYGKHDRADPYVVAHAKLSNYVVVTEEKNHLQRMPVVCAAEGLACINLADLIVREP